MFEDMADDDEDDPLIRDDPIFTMDVQVTTSGEGGREGGREGERERERGREGGRESELIVESTR